MPNQYGPWATMIDLGGSPQLSTFWRRRLTMLVSASQTSFVLSRRNVTGLGAVALLMMALPAIRFATAAEGDVHTRTMSSGEGTPTNSDVANPRQGDNLMTFQGYVATSGNDGPGAGYVHLPVFVYSQIGRTRTRRQLRFTPDQEKKLIEISRDCIKREEETRQQIQKELEKLSPEDRIARQGKLQTRLGQALNSDAVRKQIESLLTKDQLTELRAGSITPNAISRLMPGKELHEKVGVSQRQTKELESLVKEEQQREAARLSTRADSVEQRMLAVVTPEQWAKLERDVAASGGVLPYDPLSFSEFGVLLFSRGDDRKQLGLTAKQQATVRELFEESQTQFGQTLAGVASKDAIGRAQVARRQAELRKKVHVDVDRILTKEQSAVLAALTLRQCFLSSLNMAIFSCTPAVEARDGLLSQIKLSPVQWKELCRLYDEKRRVNWQDAREVGEGVLKILSPEQQDKFFEEWGRDYPWTIAPPSSKRGGKAG